MIPKHKPASLTRSRFKHVVNLVLSVTSALALSLTTLPSQVRANPVQSKKPTSLSSSAMTSVCGTSARITAG